MKNSKNLAVWLDHSSAYLIEISTEIMNTKTIKNDFSFFDKIKSLHKSENKMHNKEQQRQHAFFKKIEKNLNKFDNILLFGPTNAKKELFNHIRMRNSFDSFNLKYLNTDEMTNDEKSKYALNYFNN